MSLATGHDDRLKRVLALPATDVHDRAVRWHQLVELLAAGGAGERALIDRAIQAVRNDSALIDEESRTQAERAIASIAAPRERVGAVAGDSAIPLGSEADEPLAGHDRTEPSAMAVADRPLTFNWECDESGEIDWVEGVPRGAVIGRSIRQPVESGPIDPAADRAFTLRMPLRDATLELPGAIAGGRWTINGMPAFDPSTGRFCGYRGIAGRASPGTAPMPRPALRDPDALRELAHEIRTPLNAIVGFAEIISGQYLGPAGRPYRERADGIVAQARLLLSAIDDLDFAASVRSKPDSAATGLAGAIGRVAGAFGEAGARFDISAEPATSLDPALSERLVSRFCKTVIDLSDEPPTFALDEDDRHCIVSTPSPRGDSDLGLRLVHGLARIAGGDLRTGSGRLELLLPKH